MPKGSIPMEPGIQYHLLSLCLYNYYIHYPQSFITRESCTSIMHPLDLFVSRHSHQRKSFFVKLCETFSKLFGATRRNAFLRESLSVTLCRNSLLSF